MFCDEAGKQNMSAGYYLLTLVLHDQSSTPLVLWDERVPQDGAKNESLKQMSR
ncbi:MAG: hypothetical protein IKG22_00015 [Atopobiaceae bacterium]|nr:hypothetical protein [Atopobiaceae bacterium]